MKPDFKAIFDDLKRGAVDLSKLTLHKYKDEAEADIKVFLEDSKSSLERWTMLLANGDLTPADFEWLVESQKDLLAMHALEQTALSKIRLEHFKKSAMNLVIDTVLDRVVSNI